MAQRDVRPQDTVRRHHKILSAATLAFLVSWNCNAQVYSQHIVGGGDSQLPPNYVSFFSTVTTNETGAVYATETFTRGGQTNLVRVTKTVEGKVAVRQQKFYHNGEQVAVFMYWAQTKSESFTTAESSSYSVGLDFSATRDIERLIISRKKGSVLDGFSFTNGIFYPMSDSDLQPHDLK